MTVQAPSKVKLRGAGASTLAPLRAPVQSLPDEPLISIQILKHVTDCLEVTGHSPDALLQKIGLSRIDFGDQDKLVPVRDYLFFFEEASALSRNPHFGLHAGRLTSSDSLGALSFLFLSAPTLGTAFRSFTHYLDVMQEAARHSFSERGPYAIFEYCIADDHLSRRRQDSEYSIGTIYSLCRQYVGNDFQAAEIHFEHERAGGYTRYQEYFNCEVFFEQGSNYLLFDKKFLDRQTSSLSHSLFPIISSHLDRKLLERHHPDCLSEEIKLLLDSIDPEQLPAQNEVAEMFGISVATMSRKLKDENTSWRTLTISRKMTAAARLLQESRRQISDIALAVGYSEGASFTRAFAAYFGETPKQYRNRKRASA